MQLYNQYLFHLCNAQNHVDTGQALQLMFTSILRMGEVTTAKNKNLRLLLGTDSPKLDS